VDQQQRCRVNSKGVPVKDRVAMFTRLVQLQDAAEELNEEEVVLSKRAVAAEYGVGLLTVQAIESEGLRRGWLEQYVDAGKGYVKDTSYIRRSRGKFVRSDNGER
jgi:hypothetical protein